MPGRGGNASNAAMAFVIIIVILLRSNSDPRAGQHPKVFILLGAVRPVLFPPVATLAASAAIARRAAAVSAARRRCLRPEPCVVQSYGSLHVLQLSASRQNLLQGRR